MMPFVSVIVPCRNEARFVERCLRSVLASDYPRGRMEVLVVDGQSDDGTRELIQRFSGVDSRVRLLENARRDTPSALNLGIAAAAGDVVARIDAHAAVAPDYFTRCVNALEFHGADCVGGAMRTLPRDAGCFAEPIVSALSHWFGVGNSRFRTGASEPRLVDTVFGACWRRDVFERVGMFHPDLLRSQDMEFSLRLKAAGGKTLLLPEAVVEYYARSRLRDFTKHNFINGRWAVLPFLYSPVIPVSMRHLIPLLFTAALAAGAALLRWSPWPLAAVAIPYVLLNLAVSWRLAAHSRRWAFVVSLPVVFALLHLGYGAGSLAGSFEACWVTLRRLPNSDHPKETPCLPRP